MKTDEKWNDPRTGPEFDNPTTGESDFEIAQGMIKPPTTGEWTVELIEGWIRFNPTTWKSVLAFEHNAALAAEREEVQRLNEVLKSVEWNDGQIAQLREQLAAAQAAIAKWKMVDYESDTPTVWLDAAIAAAQQPLVDALNGIADGDTSVDAEEFANSCIYTARRALAKVKEGK